jgi:hypothetical protein
MGTVALVEARDNLLQIRSQIKNKVAALGT